MRCCNVGTGGNKGADGESGRRIGTGGKISQPARGNSGQFGAIGDRQHSVSGHAFSGQAVFCFRDRQLFAATPTAGPQISYPRSRRRNRPPDYQANNCRLDAGEFLSL